MNSIRIRVALLIVLSSVIIVRYGTLINGDRKHVHNTSLVLASQLPSVATITVSDANQSVHMEKDTIWSYYNGTRIPVDQNKVALFLQALTENRKLRPLSDNPESWSMYGLDEVHATKVTLTTVDSVIIAELYFGVERLGGSEICMRTGRDISTWVITNDISDFLSTNMRTWCKMEIASFENTADGADDIQYVSVEFPSERGGYVLQRTTNREWSLTGAGSNHSSPIAHTLIAEWILTFFGARGSDIIIPDALSITVPPCTILTIITGTGNSHVFYIYDTGATDFVLIKNKTESWYYMISRWTLDRLIPDVTRFLQ